MSVLSNLPGLSLASPSSSLEQVSPATPSRINAESRTIHLDPGSEWRFEVGFNSTITVSLQEPSANRDDANSNPTAELFGTELAPAHPYSFTGTKAAIYSHYGCDLYVEGGPCESDYVADDTPMTFYTNVHFALENLREEARSLISQGASSGAAGTDIVGGPRVLVIGPENTGKTSFVKLLTAYAQRAGRSPCVVNLDPRESLLCVPGNLSAAVFGPGAPLDIVDNGNLGWGSSSVTGPTTLPTKMPLVYHYGRESPRDDAAGFKRVISRMAVAVTARFDEDEDVKVGGLILDSPGDMGEDLIAHVVSEFSINVLLVLGSDRLYTEMSRKFASTATNSSSIPQVVKLPLSGGVAKRTATFLKAQRHAQIRTYFFGSLSTPLSPYTLTVDPSTFSVWRLRGAGESSGSDESDEEYSPDFLPGGLSDYATEGSGSDKPELETTTLKPAATNAVLAVKHAGPGDSADAVRDATVMGFVFVVEVELEKKRARVLSPVGGRLPGRACVWGPFPEGSGNLVG